MAKSFHLQIMTAEGTLLEGEAEYCRIPTADGSVGILADHAPMLCAIRKGEMRIQTEEGTEKAISLSDGAACVRDNSVTVLADHAEN